MWVGACVTVAAVSITDQLCSAIGTKWVGVQDVGVLGPRAEGGLCAGAPPGGSLPWVGWCPADCLLPLVLKAK